MKKRRNFHLVDFWEKDYMAITVLLSLLSFIAGNVISWLYYQKGQENLSTGMLIFSCIAWGFICVCGTHTVLGTISVFLDPKFRKAFRNQNKK